ncbi:MAG: hypothetical protein U0353_26040 [Sandaracinus sp.]
MTTKRGAGHGKPVRRSVESRREEVLRFHLVPLPKGGAREALWRAQVGPLLDQALADGPDGLSLLTRFEVRAAEVTRYDLTLFCDDDGAVYRHGTTELVASFSQGGATGSEDHALLDALNAAHATWRATSKSKSKPSAKPVAKPQSKAEAKADSKAGSRAEARPGSRSDTPAVGPSSSVEAASLPDSVRVEVPRYATIFAPNIVELGKASGAKVSAGLLRIGAAPSAKELESLATWLAGRASRFVVELGKGVPLEVLAHLEGVPFVVLGAGRAEWKGLAHLPRSVRRLSIRKAKDVSLAALPHGSRISSIDLEAPRVSGGEASLGALETLAWTGAEDASWASGPPRLRELALRSAKITCLPACESVERLLVFKPSALKTLRGIERMPRLSYLRVDHPAGMERLGALSECRALETIHLTAAHRIGSLVDLASAPKLRRLGVIQSQLDGAPFVGLKGRLEGGSFQLKSGTLGRALLAELGVPFVKTHEVEGHLFDT